MRILVGPLIGWGTGSLLKGKGYGPRLDILMGGAGGVAGGGLKFLETVVEARK